MRAVRLFFAKLVDDVDPNPDDDGDDIGSDFGGGGGGFDRMNIFQRTCDAEGKMQGGTAPVMRMARARGLARGNHGNGRSWAGRAVGGWGRWSPKIMGEC